MGKQNSLLDLAHQKTYKSVKIIKTTSQKKCGTPVLSDTIGTNIVHFVSGPW